MKDEGVCYPLDSHVGNTNGQVIANKTVDILTAKYWSQKIRVQWNVSPSSYPTDAFEQVVPFDSSRQYPNVPNVTVPLYPPSDMLALRKYTDFKKGTQNETTASRIVATSVQMKPGVAGRKIPIFVDDEWKDYEGDRQICVE